MCRLFPCIPIFRRFFSIKKCKKNVFVEWRLKLHCYLSVFWCEKGYEWILALGGPKTYYLCPWDPLLFVDNNHDCSSQSTIPIFNLNKTLKRNYDFIFTMESKNDKTNYMIVKVPSFNKFSFLLVVIS